MNKLAMLLLRCTLAALPGVRRAKERGREYESQPSSGPSGDVMAVFARDVTNASAERPNDKSHMSYSSDTLVWHQQGSAVVEKNIFRNA